MELADLQRLISCWIPLKGKEALRIGVVGYLHLRADRGAGGIYATGKSQVCDRLISIDRSGVKKAVENAKHNLLISSIRQQCT